MNLFVIFAFLAVTTGKGNSTSPGDKNAHHSNEDTNQKHHDSHQNKTKQDNHDNDHENKHDNGHGDNHLPAPDAEDPKKCDVEYVFLESATKTERCIDGKNFFYTDRYKNETFCSNSATIDDGECWWDTSIGSNCLESTECVWLTDNLEQGMCYCSHSGHCEACEHQTPAPTVNMATSQCPDMCEVYYLGCAGMYCKCLGECTSPEEAGCSEPVNSGCHRWYFDEREEDGEDSTITDVFDEFIDETGETVADRIVNFVDEYGEGRYEIFGDYAYEYRNGLLMRIINTRLVDLDHLILSESHHNDWLDDLITRIGADDDNDWQWPWSDW